MLGTESFSLLSGGMDSSCVVSLATEAGGRPVHAVSIGFEEASHDELDDARVDLPMSPATTEMKAKARQVFEGLAPGGNTNFERALRADPGAAYAAMDFASRDRYRHVIEEVAKASGLAEEAVAGQAIELARTVAARHGVDDRAAHVGYYLIDRGRVELIQADMSRFDLDRRFGLDEVFNLFDKHIRVDGIGHNDSLSRFFCRVFTRSHTVGFRCHIRPHTNHT